VDKIESEPDKKGIRFEIYRKNIVKRKQNINYLNGLGFDVD